jgi:hypothetical protein
VAALIVRNHPALTAVFLLASTKKTLFVLDAELRNQAMRLWSSFQGFFL